MVAWNFFYQYCIKITFLTKIYFDSNRLQIILPICSGKNSIFNPENENLKQLFFFTKKTQETIKLVRKVTHEKNEACKRRNSPGTSKFIKLPAGGKDDEGNLGVTENGKLAGLLEQPNPALGEGDLPAGGILNPLDLNLTPPHILSSLLLLLLPHHHLFLLRRKLKNPAP